MASIIQVYVGHGKEFGFSSNLNGTPWAILRKRMAQTDIYFLNAALALGRDGFEQYKTEQQESSLESVTAAQESTSPGCRLFPCNTPHHTNSGYSLSPLKTGPTLVGSDQQNVLIQFPR